MQKILKSYLKRLTNLSSRNRSLLLLNLPTEQFLDVHELNFLLEKSSFEFVAQLIDNQKEIPVCEVLDSRFEKANEVSKKLRRLSRTEQFIAEERGAQDLYVGFPFVKGKFADGTVVRAPLLFFPVTLITKAVKSPKTSQVSEHWLLRQRDEPLSINRSLALAYAHFNGTKVEDDILESTFDDFDTDPLRFLTQLYEWLKDSPFTINFNQDIFTQQLIHFERFAKKDLDLLEHNGELKLFPQAVLGIFPQAGSYLVPDYEFLLDKNLGQEVIGSEQKVEMEVPQIETEDLSSIFQNSLLGFESRLLKEEDLLAPLALDASQEQAIRRTKAGQSLVVQGPPGTGKSQLICNLIADFTAQGKQVLVVSQKRAALDTVFERLHHTQMTDFVALVHDFKNDRKALYEQIANQIERIDEFKRQNYSLDAIFLERQFLQISRRIDQIVKELDEFKVALFDDLECGLSVKELYLTSSPEQPHVNLKNHYQYFHFQQLDEFLRKLNAYEQYARQVNVPTHPWCERVSFEAFSFKDVSVIQEVIQTIPTYYAKLLSQISATLGQAISDDDLMNLQSHQVVIEDVNKLLADNISFELLHNLLDANISKKFENQLLEKFEQIEGYQQEGIITSLKSEELVTFGRSIQAAIEAQNSLFGWWFFAEKSQIKSVAAANGLSTQKQDLFKLEKLHSNRLSFERCLEEVDELIKPQKPVVTNDLLLTISNSKSIEQAFAKAQKAKQLLHQKPSIVRSIFADGSSLSDCQEKQAMLTKCWQDFEQKQSHWRNYLVDSQIQNLILSPIPYSSQLSQSLSQDFDFLHEADVLKASFSRNEWEVIEKIFSYLAEYPNAEVSSAIQPNGQSVLQNTLRLAWIEHIEAKYPILRGVSSLKISQLEDELQGCIRQKQSLSQQILLIKLREQTYQNLEINRLRNVVTYRDLKHQVTKKRHIWPIRKLMGQFSDEVFQLVPCWMASPEAVSAIFPMEKLFDVVIFDEASQCFAEQGIPAVYRGKQVVIAGDSKQLQPADLYRIRYEEYPDDIPELEIDSLLDLACQYLPQTQLRGHYRSRSLDLIDFSNQHFYQNTLQLLPDFQEINKRKPAIHYLKTEGVWQDNINEIEAQRITELVRELSKNEPDKSIGIVTFNYHQQNLIANLTIPRSHEGIGGDMLFVKNIENVQGDERDIIIFSVGYAPDAKGKMVMQFGSLNAAGGENRLNVAVTRARERVYVVASIWPEQLHVENTTHNGPKLLKKYLEYALNVSEGKYRPQPLLIEGYRTDWMLKKQLVNRPLPMEQLISELPFADLTIKNGNQYESLILTDDDLYFQSLSAKETHAYLPFGLQDKGWPYQRMWSRAFWQRKLE